MQSRKLGLNDDMQSYSDMIDSDIFRPCSAMINHSVIREWFDHNSFVSVRRISYWVCQRLNDDLRQ
jgi:hypothetical protein